MQLILDKEVDSFIETFQQPTRAKWLRTIMLLAQYGNELGMPHAKRLSGNLSELRIRGKQEIRAFYTCIGNTIYILHAFTKKTQKIPQKEIEIARKRMYLLT